MYTLISHAKWEKLRTGGILKFNSLPRKGSSIVGTWTHESILSYGNLTGNGASIWYLILKWQRAHRIYIVKARNSTRHDPSPFIQVIKAFLYTDRYMCILYSYIFSIYMYIYINIHIYIDVCLFLPLLTHIERRENVLFNLILQKIFVWKSDWRYFVGKDKIILMRSMLEVQNWKWAFVLCNRISWARYQNIYFIFQ